MPAVLKVKIDTSIIMDQRSDPATEPGAVYEYDGTNTDGVNSETETKETDPDATKIGSADEVVDGSDSETHESPEETTAI